MEMIGRTLQPVIEKQLYKGKAIVLHGPRRVGKTTLSKLLLPDDGSARYLNCELLENKMALTTKNSVALYSFLGNYRLIILDEAQHIPEIGLILKILQDTFPNMQVIATGSSSFDLGNKISEPLTGRAREYLLLPFSVEEILTVCDSISLHAGLDQLLRFGAYPEVYGKPEQEAIEELNQISGNYLYKDILQFENLKRPQLILNLLTAIALQLGSEVSLNELSRMLKETVPTIHRYLDLLEKAFVIFRLRSFSRNQRNEIARGQKVYFYDLGIRNALIRNFNPLNLRMDTGGLWENFCIMERMKFNNNHRRFVNSWFWRTYDQREIDYVEESAGELTAFEFKFNPKERVKPDKQFMTYYPGTKFVTIHRENFQQLFE